MHMTSPAKRARIIQNPTSGRRRARREREIAEALRSLRNAGIAGDAVSTEARGHATELARAAASNFDLVIACGGDGTINEIANGLAHSQTPLAILPAGTANVFAKELEIPWNIPAAARLIPGSLRRRIALGAVDFPAANGAPASVRYFLSVAGAGPDGELVRKVSDDLKYYTGTLAYWYEGFRQLFLYRFPGFSINGGGECREARLLVVGRTKSYGGPFRITTEANLFEDLFEMMATNSTNPLRYFGWLPPLLMERLRGYPGIEYWKGAEALCEPLIAEKPVYAQVDGEPIGPLPLRFRVAPDALTICVPSGVEAA
jgi:YegS/Rv2252/BmrU family lipid kinase